MNVSVIEGLPSEPNDRLESHLREIAADGRYDLEVRLAAHRKLQEIRPTIPPVLHDIELHKDSDDLSVRLGDYPGRKTVYLHYPPTNDAWVRYGAYPLVANENRWPHIKMVKTDLRFECGLEPEALERVARAWSATHPSTEDLTAVTNALRKTEERLMKELKNHPRLQEPYHRLIDSPIPPNAMAAINWKYQRLIALCVAMRRETDKGIMILPAEVISLVRTLE